MAILSYGGNRQFAYCALLFQGLLCLLFGLFAQYDEVLAASGSKDSDPSANVSYYYAMFQDVHVMIFIGFGFLMTFLHKFAFSSVGLNFFLAALAIQWTIFCVNFWHSALDEAGFAHKISMTITSLIIGDFGAGAVLITFGALLGKTSPLQMLMVLIIELIFYAVNENIGAVQMQAVDMGGSMFVHTFGAYFGLACSRALCPAPKDINNADNKSSKTSDQFAMIGTVFLWMFWPSFNGALAFNADAPGSQQRVVVNTVLALCGCCISAFAASALLRGDKKFDMVDIQNATLAGGVAVGSSADLVIQPWGAVLVGVVAGFVSVAGYVYVSPWLEERFGISDTCGVHNLHGMPGVIGGLGGAISAATATAGMAGYDADQIKAIFSGRGPPPTNDDGTAKYAEDSWMYKTYDRSAGKQGAFQFYALLTTLAMATSTGALTGWIVGKAGGGDPGTMFDDAQYWEVPHEDHDDDGAAGGGGGGAKPSAVASVELSSV